MYSTVKVDEIKTDLEIAKCPAWKSLNYSLSSPTVQIFFKNESETVESK